ncbi:hypothetical protein TWF281_011059 [Arthrobotrys megalospora]
MPQDNETKTRRYLANCSFLSQLSAGNDEIKSQIIARVNHCRDVYWSTPHFTRDPAINKILDDLAGLLVRRPDECVAVAVTWLTGGEIQMVAAISPGEDIHASQPANAGIFSRSIFENQRLRVESHAREIFKHVRDYIAESDEEAKGCIEERLRLSHIQYNLPEISRQFDRIQDSLEAILALKEDAFKPPFLEEPSEVETEYFVDQLSPTSTLRDEGLTENLIQIYAASDDRSDTLKTRLRRDNIGLHEVTFDNIYIWHELFTCTFMNTRRAIKRALKLQNLHEKSKNDDFLEMIRTLGVYLEYMTVFARYSNIFRRYVGIVTKLAARYEELSQLQERSPGQGGTNGSGSARVQDTKENQDDKKGKSHVKPPSRTRQVFRRILSTPRLMLLKFRPKSGDPQKKEARNSEKPATSRCHKKVPPKSKFETNNELFRRCCLLSNFTQRASQFLADVTSTTKLLDKQPMIEVLSPDIAAAQLQPGEKLATGLHRFLYLGYLTPSEMSERVGQFIDFLRTVISDQNRYQELISALNDDNPMIPTFYHAELTILAKLGPSPQLAYPYIGISRPPCVVCEHMITQQQTVYARKGSGRVYALSIPDGISDIDRNYAFDNIKNLTGRVVDELRTRQRNQNPDEYEDSGASSYTYTSSSGGSPNYPTFSTIEDRENQGV